MITMQFNNSNVLIALGSTSGLNNQCCSYRKMKLNLVQGTKMTHYLQDLFSIDNYHKENCYIINIK